MPHRESGLKRLIKKVVLNTELRKFLKTLNRESGLERLTRKVALNA